MITVNLHRKFEKQFVKLQKKIRSRFKERRNIFIVDPYNPLLNNHALQRIYSGYRSINITGDVRAIYYEQAHKRVLFIAIGTHHELFGT